MQTQVQTQLENLAPSNLYHMTHIDNLSSIFEHGLLAHNNSCQKVDISNQSVNARRASIYEPIFNRSLHDYVPFYFNPRNAMLYKTQIEYGRNIVILTFDSEILLQENSLFTMGNAASRSTRYSNDIDKLETFNWNLIFSRSWNGYPKHVKQAMMSEVLVYKKQSLKKLMCINTRYQKDADYLNNFFSCNLFKQDSSLFFENL